jgi:hypothetical protein
MIKTAPNIIVPFDDKSRIKNLIMNVINDSWIFQVVPDSITLNGRLFTLVFFDKKIVFEEVKVDISSDYVDVYLQGIKQTADKYSIVDNGSDIIISFNQDITFYPESVTAGDFLVKGKIVSR